jgi:hypothetical protein
MNAAQILAALPLLASLALAAPSPWPAQQQSALEQSRLSDQAFPGAVPLDNRGGPSVAVTCVLDARTGEPIVGARLIAVFEATYPLSGEWWSSRSVVSDSEGWVRMRLDDLRRPPTSSPAAEVWLYLEAPGYAPVVRFAGSLEPGVRLERAATVELFVRDPLDRPVSGAQVGWMLGCGHTPDLRVVHTDERGRATLSGVARGVGDLWPVARGFESTYHDLPDSQAATLRLGWAPVLRGQVVDAGGRPLREVFVGNSIYHRGPWTLTDANGRFELRGLTGPERVAVQPAGASYGELGSFWLPPDGREVTLTAGSAPEPAVAGVSIRLGDALSGEALEGVEVTLVRDGDGFTLRAHSDGEGRAELGAPAGAYDVFAVGSLWDHEPVEARLEVGAERVEPEAEPLELLLLLRPSPRIALDAAQLPAGARVVLVSAVEELYLEPAELLTLDAPVAGLIGLRVELEDRVRAVELTAAQLVPGSVIQLQAPEPVLLRLSFTTPEGEPARGWAALLAEDELLPDHRAAVRVAGSAQAAALLRTWRQGPVTLWVVPEDRRFAPRRLSLDLPLEASSFELGDVPFADPDAPMLTLLEADGRPILPGRVELRRGTEVHSLRLDPMGRLVVGTFEPLPGDSLRVESDGLLHFRVDLTGPGPWTIARPGASIALEVADEAGDPLPGFALWIDGELFESGAPSATLPGLAPGLYRAVISAPGHRSAVLTLNLALDEQRALRVLLPRRP